MSIFWVSWYQPAGDHRPLTFPPNAAILGWWCTGYRDDEAIICAMVRAMSEAGAKKAINADWPEADEWRFCDERENADLSNRFPLEGWMEPRFEAARKSRAKNRRR